MKKKVLVVGDAMMDRYVYGAADRLSPEAPTPVLRVERESWLPGGAANVAMNVAAQEVPVGLLYVCGGSTLDPAAGRLQNALAAHGVWARGVQNLRYRIPVKTRYVAKGQQIFRCDDEADPLAAGAYRQLSNDLAGEFGRLLDEVAVLVLSDYDKGCLTRDSAARLVQIATDRAIPVLVAPKAEWKARYTGATAVVANWDETSRGFCGLSGRTAEGDEPVARFMATHVAASLLCRQVFVTAGASDTHWFEAGETDPTRGTHHQVKTRPRPVCDPTGAGDTFLAALAAEVYRKTPWAEAAIRANAAAGLAVSKPGTAVVTRLEVEEELGWVDKGPRKVVAIQSAAAVAGRHQREGRRVGFVFGEYHQLKPGHVRFLKRAKEECDFLIVGVAEGPDPGPNRGGGYQEFDERLEVVSVIEDVNLVVPCPRTTSPAADVEQVVREIKPDLLFVTERHEGGRAADVVADRGGRVVVLPRL